MWRKPKGTVYIVDIVVDFVMKIHTIKVVDGIIIGRHVVRFLNITRVKSLSKHILQIDSKRNSNGTGRWTSDYSTSNRYVKHSWGICVRPFVLGLNLALNEYQSRIYFFY